MTPDDYIKSLGDKVKTLHPTVIQLIKQAFLDGNVLGAKEVTFKS